MRHFLKKTVLHSFDDESTMYIMPNGGNIIIVLEDNNNECDLSGNNKSISFTMDKKNFELFIDSLNEYTKGLI